MKGVYLIVIAYLITIVIALAQHANDQKQIRELRQQLQTCQGGHR